jgi:hypothetical protein
MPEIYRKQGTVVELVLGHYACNTTKMAFATTYRQQVHLASGKLSKGDEPKFLYKIALTMSYPELLAMLEAFDRCSKDHVNYHEFGEFTDFKGQVNRLVLKTSDYGGLVALKSQRMSQPDEFGDDEESTDPDPKTTNEVISSSDVVQWTECFEKFYISKNEDWSAMSKNLREFSNQLADVWRDDPTTSPKTPSLTGENRHPIPVVLETPTHKRKAPDTAPAAVNKKPPKKPKKPKPVPKAVPTSSGEFEVVVKPKAKPKVVKPKPAAEPAVALVESSDSSGSEEVRKRAWWQSIGGLHPTDLVERDKFYSKLQLVLF